VGIHEILDKGKQDHSPISVKDAGEKVEPCMGQQEIQEQFRPLSGSLQKKEIKQTYMPQSSREHSAVPLGTLFHCVGSVVWN
jgi:hypothetical protein